MQNGQYTTLAVPGADSTFASGINNFGQVVGTYQIDLDPSPEQTSPVLRAFLWQAGSFSTIALPGTGSGAYDINDAGTVVGFYEDGAAVHSFVKSSSGIQTIAVPGALFTTMIGINNRGVVVGYSQDGQGNYPSWRYANGSFSAIAFPPSSNCATPVARSISNVGAIVGECLSASSNSTFVLTGNTLQTLSYPGALTTFPGGINASGTVVGYYYAAEPISGFGAYIATFPVLVDPVPDLLGGDEVTDASDDLASMGRLVQGVAADGVARVVVRIPASSSGQQITVRLLNDREPLTLSTSSQEDGALAAVDAQTSWVSQVTVAADAVSGASPMDFVLYRAPEDFPRADGQDEAKASRRVYLEIMPMGGQPYVQVVEIVRPPVLLVHGLWSDRDSWSRFSPLTLDPRFRVGRADYSFSVKVEASTPSYDADRLVRTRANSLGFAFNAAVVNDAALHVVDQVANGDNPTGAAVAVVQADMVGHSMGGLLARHLATEPRYSPKQTFGAGVVHKLVTVNSPHLGSPVARRLLGAGDGCLRGLLTLKVGPFVETNNFAFASATLSDGRQVSGAVWDLADGPLSDAILRLNSSALRTTPTFFVSGNYDKWSALDGVTARAAKIRAVCGAGTNLAAARTSDGWPGVFGEQDNDAIVSVNSQINGDVTSATELFVGYVHSRGSQQLGFEPPGILNPGAVPVRVTQALNSPRYGLSFRPTPTPTP